MRNSGSAWMYRDNCFSLVAVKPHSEGGNGWAASGLPGGILTIHGITLKKNIPEIHFLKPESTYLLWLDCRELGLSRG